MTRAERLARLQGLYGIVDDGPGFRLPPFEWAAALAAGGASAIQLRFKRLGMRAALETARRIRVALPDTLLIVDDRPDLALLADADGVHVGDQDLPPRDARRILGPDRLVGATARTADAGRTLLSDGADHLGVGPVFATDTKQVDHPALGIVGLRAVCQALHGVSVVAIAGIDESNIGAVAAAGARAAAVVSAVGRADEPTRAARTLAERFTQGRP